MPAVPLPRSREHGVDEKYTEVVARRMLQMTKTINSNSTSPRIAEHGVACYASTAASRCPPMSPGPPTPGPKRGGGYAASRNSRTSRAGRCRPMASLPYDPFTTLLNQPADKIRVVHRRPSGGTGADVKCDGEDLCADDAHVDGARRQLHLLPRRHQFANWSRARPQRVTAWHGVDILVRDLNANYLGSLTSVFPREPRKGPMGDVYKVDCATCTTA